MPEERTDEPRTTAEGSAANAETPRTTAEGSAPETSISEELEQLRNQKQQWLGEKSRYEESNRELQEARARLAQYEQGQQSGYQPPTGPAGIDPRMVIARLQQRINADPEDVDAIAALSSLQFAAQANQRAAFAEALLEVPDATRPKVRELSLKHNVTPDVAKLILAGMNAESQQKRIAELEATNKQRSSPPTPTSVVTMPAKAADDGSVMTITDYQAKIAALEQQGRDREALELIGKVDRGEVRIAR